MSGNWWRVTALGVVAMASIGLAGRGQEAEPGAGTPHAAATPLTRHGDAAPVRAGDLVIVAEEHVILQPEPAYGPARVAMLPQQQTMEATGQVAMRDGERWLELRYPVTGAIGWVSDRWLILVPAAPPSTGTPAAGTGAPILTGSRERLHPASRA